MNKVPTVLLSCPLKIDAAQGRQEAEALLTDSALTLHPKHGVAKSYSYRDIIGIRAENYKVFIHAGDEKLELLHLGNKYQDFVRALIGQRNETIINDLLMQERVRRGGIAAACRTRGGQGDSVDLGNCELRLCDSALLIIPEYQEPIRLPYSYMTSVQSEGYHLHIAIGDSTYVLSKMGREFTPFSQELDQARHELMAKAQELLRYLAPTVSSAAIHLAAGLMGEGRAARRSDIEEIDPAMWTSLEKQLDLLEVRQEYDFLNSLGSAKQQCIGFKRDLAEAGSHYLWFMLPIVEKNAIAMEATSSAQTGRATYFFRIVSRDQLARLSHKELQAAAEELLMLINRCMLAINFRREPIYLADDKLVEPRFLKYRYAVLSMPELQELRRRFIGRVFHREEEQWQQGVGDLLAFNIGTKDDAAKWTKVDQEQDEAPEWENSTEDGG